jgi:uncharacterized MAPEG superfamily protein
MSDYSYYLTLAAGLLPYIFAGVAKSGSGRPYDNHDPRAFLEKAEGRQRRANNAQLNSFESFPLFAIGVLVMHQRHGAALDVQLINLLAGGYVLARALYGWAYITDRASLRSLIWMVGLLISGSLYLV